MTMSSSAFESARDKPKQTQDARSSYPNRERPLFVSRRPLQQQEFFTDSLNTSYIPSPSPPKQARDTGVGARPRRALGGARTLKAAFEATGNGRNENRPPSSSSSEKNRTEHTTKPRPTQIKARPSPGSTEVQPNHSTPSPPRGRSAAILSAPSSASSPPRGLAEAYQRIVDEENLAAQEDESVADLTGYLNSDTYRGESMERDRERVERIQNSASPIPLRVSRRGLSRASGLVDEIAAAEEEAREIEGSMEGSEGSSSMSFLENATDDSFGRALAKHARDEQRVNTVLRSGQIFRKARVGERVGLTVENLRRKNGSHGTVNISLNGTGEGSVTSDRSEPPVNVPMAWGRKGSGGKDWLCRINSKSGRGRLTGDSPKLGKDRDPITTKANETLAAEQNVDWILAAVEVPLPSIENGSSLGGSVSRGSTPTSTNRRNTSLDSIRQWEINDEDFTARSLQISNSPPIRIKNSTLDRIRDREIENLERRAVTTSRLGEIREKTSKEQLRRRSPSVPMDEPQVEPDATTDQAERRLSSPSGNHHNNRQTTLEDNGNPIPNTPVVIHRGTRNEHEKGSGVARSDHGQNEKDRRRNHERQDSLALLRQLARATSASPSPSPAKEAGDEQEQPASETEHEERLQAVPQPKQDNSSTKQNESADSDKPEDPDKTPQSETKDKTNTTPQRPRQNGPMKTPIVTGAWVDTPLPTGGRGLPLPTPADLEDVKDMTFGVDEELSSLGLRDVISGPSKNSSRGRSSVLDNRPPKHNEPEKPKSALATLLDEARRSALQNGAGPNTDEDEESPLGDDTLQSLEELIADEPDLFTLLTPDDDKLSLVNSERRPLTQKERERQNEMLAYERMNARLKALGLSIHDAKRGISKLAQQVCNEGGEFHDFIWPCEKCGCSGRNDDVGMWRGGERGWQISIPIPRLWTWRKGERLKLTWLGLFTLLGWAWLITELTVW